MAAKRCLDQDPDYENIPVHTNEKRLKILEHDARTATVKKLDAILRSHFTKEIANREAEIDVVNERIHETRAMLDRLRACIVAKYYATAGQVGEQTKQDTLCSSIHPTVKTFLGKAPRAKKSLQTSASTPIESLNGESSQPSISTSSDPIISSLTSTETSLLSTYTTSTSSVSQVSSEISGRASRLKTKCCVVVGNVSKYIPSDQREESDQSTHKWMVYVRGDKDNPQINHIVRKVLFFLHPSYRPNDIVEVIEPPFHLTRKGWGEFPVRVQLHFHNQRNKPVDIIHNLKLDKTYTGLQTLGSETMVDLLLFRNENSTKSQGLLSSSLVKSPTREMSERISHLDGPSMIHKLSSVNKETSEAININSKNTVPVDRDISLPLKSYKPVISKTFVPSEKCTTSTLSASSLGHQLPEENMTDSHSALPSALKSTSFASGFDSSNSLTLNISTSHQITAVPSKAIPKVSLLPLSASSCQGLSVASSITLPSVTQSNSSLGSKMILLVSSGPSKQSSEIPKGNTVTVAATKQNLIANSKTATISSVKIASSTSSGEIKHPVSTTSPQNGINKFVKCIDSQGRILLVPQSSLILVQSPSSKAETSKTHLNPVVQITSINPQEDTSHGIKQEHQSVCVGTSPQINKSFNQNIVLEKKATSDSAKTTENAIPSYTVKVVPGQGINKPSQVILIPTSSQSVISDNKRLTNSGSQSLPSQTSKHCDKENMHKGQSKLVKKGNSESDVKEALSALRHCKFDSLAQLVSRLVLIYPLVSNNADRSFHPYCASSLEAFFSWNIGKRRAAEWQRASCIRTTLQELAKEKENSFSWTVKELWTRKQIMWWCRKHGYTPFRSGRQEQQEQQFCRNESRLSETVSTPHDLLSQLEEKQQVHKTTMSLQDDDIDILNIDDDDDGDDAENKSTAKNQDSRHIKIHLPPSRPDVEFVREAASMIGVKLEAQEIIPSVSAPVVEEMLLEACQQFANDILRTALCQGFDRHGGKICPEEVTVEDVCKSLQELPFCDFLTNSFLGISTNPVENAR